MCKFSAPVTLPPPPKKKYDRTTITKKITCIFYILIFIEFNPFLPFVFTFIRHFNYAKNSICSNRGGLCLGVKLFYTAVDNTQVLQGIRNGKQRKLSRYLFARVSARGTGGRRTCLPWVLYWSRWCRELWSSLSIVVTLTWFNHVDLQAPAWYSGCITSCKCYSGKSS